MTATIPMERQELEAHMMLHVSEITLKSYFSKWLIIKKERELFTYSI